MPRYIRHRRHHKQMRHRRHRPLAQLTGNIGGMQYYTASGGWQSSVPAGRIKVGQVLSEWFRAAPNAILEKDDGTFKYAFELTGTGTAGLQLLYDGSNLVMIDGTAPAASAGKTVIITPVVTDAFGVVKRGSSITVTLSA